MKVRHTTEITDQPVTMEGATGCRVRWLLGEKDGTPNFAMRQFEVAPGGHTPRHSHPYEHEVFVLEGEGEFTIGDEAVTAGAGMTVLAPAGITHGVENKGNQRLVILMGLTPWQT